MVDIDAPQLQRWQVQRDGMVRGLDHVVHVVRDLESAAASYQRLGFIVGARNGHPWGTENRLVLVPGCYVELLAVAEPAKIPRHGPASFSFGAFNRAFLNDVGEGLAQLALASSDPQAEKATFDRAGFGGFDVFDFSRKGKRADGSEIEVAFSLTFARDPASPHAGFFTCLHKTPENIWLPELQQHANGVEAVGAVVLVAENPTDHHVFLQVFAGVRDIHASSRGISIPTPRGSILALDPRSFRDTFGADPPYDEGLRLGAVVFKAGDLAATHKELERHGVEAHIHRDKVVVSGQAAHGAVLAFEAS